MDEYVKIKKSEYDELVKRVEWLEWLECAGVDTWEGYACAQELRDEECN